jgi:phage terminase large subunit
VNRSAIKKSLNDIEAKVKAKSNNSEKIVYGIVNMQREVIRRWQYQYIDNDWRLQEVDKEPDVLLPENLEKLLTVKKKYKVVYGGRGGTKSVTISNLLVSTMNDFADDVMCFREVQKSLKSSVFKGMAKQIAKCGLDGFRTIPSQGEIRHDNGAEASFWGLSGNLDDIKGLTGYKRFWTDEAEKTSEESLTTMGPTLRGIPGAELWFSLNPKSRKSPIAQEFLVPFERELIRDGYYEDDHYLIIKVGYETNPWFELDETLVEEIEKDRNRVKSGSMTQEKFDHVWHGAYNDDVDNALIRGDWLDACLDAHKVLNFEAQGVEVVAHDPSDEGPDPKGLAYRHGSIIKDVKEKSNGDVNTGSDWAVGYAIANKVDRGEKD